MFQVRKTLIYLIKNLRFLSAVSIRLVKITGKSSHAIHPKHLINKSPWFLPYLKKSDTVLDVGSGNGENSFWAASKVKKLTGLDKSFPLITIKKAEFFKADLEHKLSLSNKSFDVVLCLDVLEHISKRVQLLGEIRRVLKPKGLLLLSLPNSETSWKKLQRKYKINSFTDPDHKVEYKLSEISEICSIAKFKILDVSPVTFDTPWAPIIDMIGGLHLPLYEKLINFRTHKVLSEPNETTGFRIVAKKIE